MFKGLSFDLYDKCFVVEVEDYLLDYVKFEGDIEVGYGKGYVDCFDYGVWLLLGDVEV